MKKLLLFISLANSYAQTNQSLAIDMKAKAINSALQEAMHMIYSNCLRLHFNNDRLNKTTAIKCEEEIDHFIALFFEENNSSNPDHRDSFAQKILRNN